VAYRKNQLRLAKFGTKDVVDVRLPGAPLGDGEQEKVIQVRNCKAGALYKVRTFSGYVFTVEEDDLRLAVREQDNTARPVGARVDQTIERCCRTRLHRFVIGSLQ